MAKRFQFNLRLVFCLTALGAVFSLVGGAVVRAGGARATSFFSSPFCRWSVRLRRGHTNRGRRINLLQNQGRQNPPISFS
jgi:hypothetical protein